MASPQLLSRRRTFRRDLLTWFRISARDLPWRRTPSVYRTVVSEFMLQQTQVKTMLPHFERWMRRFPSFAVLSRASEPAVLRAWEGLGYYSRARNLHRLARILAAQKALPRTPEAWQALPGVGPYTAAAITSIAFNARIACVDGNVVRVLARLTANGRRFRNGAEAVRLLAPLAQALLSRRAPGRHNEAMMELGATVCLPRNPLCPACPVRRLCLAFRTGNPESYPRRLRRTIERQAVTRVWCERRGALLLHRIDAGATRLAGQHELPRADQLGLEDDAAGRLPLLGRRWRSITRYRIEETIRIGTPPRGHFGSGLVWVPLGRLDDLTLSGPHRRWLGELLAARAPTPQSARGSGPGSSARPRQARGDSARARGDALDARMS